MATTGFLQTIQSNQASEESSSMLDVLVPLRIVAQVCKYTYLYLLLSISVSIIYWQSSNTQLILLALYLIVFS